MQYIKYTGFDHVWQYWGTWTWYLIGFYLCLPFITYYLLPSILSKGVNAGKKKSIAIFVMGDLGHSPRMTYHALSFSKKEYYVNLCGYINSPPPQEVYEDANIDMRHIDEVKNIHNLPYVLFAAYKALYQVLQLALHVYEFRGSDYFMIQNPPSVPLLLVILVCKALFSRNTKVVIDWHNLNYTILGLKLGNQHKLVQLVRFYEKYLGKLADIHLTVTRKMKQFLVDEFGFEKSHIIVLHDRPGPQFTPETPEMRKRILMHGVFLGIDSTHKLAVSSTSYTPDEDFNILLDALEEYEKMDTPPLLMVVTGKGPMKQQFLDRVERLSFSKVKIRTTWLEQELYPLMLAAADFGISLHTSSSGIDLPMKIVDLFGAGVPVISMGFPAIGELVNHGINGLVASGEKNDLLRLLVELTTDEVLLARLKKGAMEESDFTWEKNWNKQMAGFK